MVTSVAYYAKVRIKMTFFYADDVTPLGINNENIS